MIASLSTGQNAKAGDLSQLRVFRIFALSHAKNEMYKYRLEGTAFSIKQFQTEYIAVSETDRVEVFNVMAKCKLRDI